MLNPSSTSAQTVTTSADPQKYAVADILSTFATTGEHPNTALPLNLSKSIAVTSTTDILTPTTLANLEETFLELQTNSGTLSVSNLPRESGFVPPVVDPVPATSMVKQEYDNYALYQDDSGTDPDWQPSGPKRGRYDDSAVMMQSYSVSQPTTTGGRRRKANDNLSPEEEAKRSLRRERNKVAAAKCRQRRVDLTNELINESEGLEEEQAKLENEITMLQNQKEQLEFLLEAHKPVCSACFSGSTTTSSASASAIKTEVMDVTYPSILTTATVGTSTNQAVFQTANSTAAIIASGRPNSLSIPSSNHSTQATGIPITTPSGVFNFGLESMLDGHTGLTPITGTPSCASQLHRGSTDGSSTPTENLSSPTLLAL